MHYHKSQTPYDQTTSASPWRFFRCIWEALLGLCRFSYFSNYSTDCKTETVQNLCFIILGALVVLLLKDMKYMTLIRFGGETQSTLIWQNVWHMEMCSSSEKCVEACQLLTFVVYSQLNLLGKGFNGQPELIKNTQTFSMSGDQTHNSVPACHNVFVTLRLTLYSP